MPVKDDKNRNGQRAGQKAEWKKFHKALAHLSDGHNAAETWAELKRKKARNLQTKFMAAWLVDKKWENALTPDPHSWAYNRRTNGTQYLSVEYFVHELIETVAFGGNMLLNVLLHMLVSMLCCGR